MKTSIMAILFILIPLSTALTVQQGVDFVYGNVNNTFDQVVTGLDTITIGSDYLKIDDDNLSFNPGIYDLNVTISSYVDKRNNNLYLKGESQNVNFMILSDNMPSSIIFNNNAYMASFTSPSVKTKFTYYSNYNVSITFKDENNDYILDDRNISVNIIGLVYGQNYTVEHGSLNLTNLVEDEYIIQYSAPNYTTRFYYMNYYTSPVTSLTLYLANSSTASTVTINVFDKTGFKLPGATIKVLKYFVSTHSYQLVEIGKTNFQGSTTVSIDINNNYYKFLIDYDGTTVYSSAETIVYSTTLNFYVDITQQYLNDVFDQFNINGELSFNDHGVYGSANFLYDDADNLASQGCVYAYKMVDGAYDFYNSSCINVSAGSITTNVNNVSGEKYYFVGYVKKQGVVYKISSLYYNYGEVPFDQNAGLWIMFLIMGVMALTFFINPIVGVVLTSIVPLLFQITRIYGMGYEVAVPIFATGLILAVIMGGNR